MTRDQKLTLCLQERASAFERISNLLLVLDSHRNFHRRVEQEVVETNARIREINRAPTTPCEQFRCTCRDLTCTCEGRCKREASQQVTLIAQFEENTETALMCDQCANHALHCGKAIMVEEQPFKDV